MASIDNKRIAINTLFLYVRMLIVMGISLYTVRITLDVLGFVDYGVYNVVAGVVSMFSFIKGSLATSSQRFFSVEIAQGNIQSLNKQFCLNLTIFIFLSIIIFVVLETVGLYIVNTQLKIPADRVTAANIIYQFSIFSLVVQLISVPYDALIVSYERMRAFAYIGIVEAFFKLIIVFLLYLLPFDNLIVFGFLLFLFTSVITFTYYTYCKKELKGSEYSFLWDKKSLKTLFSFTGWHFLGTIAVAIKGHGINILINMFFSPAVNAARAISFQIENSLLQFSNNFFTAVKPQMYKAYANNELESLFVLINRSAVICSFLMSVISIPLIVLSDHILSWWLKEVPPYTISFTQLILFNGIVDSTNNSVIAPALATGKIKKYQILVSLVLFMNLPLSYLALKFNYNATSTVVVSIAISFVAVILRAYLLKQMISFPMSQYFTKYFMIILSSVFCILVLFRMKTMFDSVFMELFLISIISTIMLVLIYWFFICNKNDRYSIAQLIRKKLEKSHHE